eukprot:1924912-Amphidinium_carterae.2
MSRERLQAVMGLECTSHALKWKRVLATRSHASEGVDIERIDPIDQRQTQYIVRSLAQQCVVILNVDDFAITWEEMKTVETSSMACPERSGTFIRWHGSPHDKRMTMLLSAVREGVKNSTEKHARGHSLWKVQCCCCSAACIQAAVSPPSLPFNSVLITDQGKVQPTNKQPRTTGEGGAETGWLNLELALPA